MAKLLGVGFRLGVGTIVQTEDGQSRDRDRHPINLAATFGEEPTQQQKGDRYRGGKSYVGRQPIGFANELHPRNHQALMVWYLSQPKAHQDKYEGIPLEIEAFDVAHRYGRRGDGWYQTWFYDAQPTIVTAANWSSYALTMKRLGVKAPGSYRDPALDPFGYTRSYKVLSIPEGEAPEEPPAPPPPPPEPPPPEPEPEPPPFPPIGPYLSSVEQSAAEWVVWIGDHVKGWAPRWVKLGWKALEPDPKFRGLVRLAVRIKRRLLGETEGWGRP